MADVSAALSALSQAISNELEGKDFYAGCAQRAADPDAKKVFESLVQDEEQHLRILRNEYDQLSSQGSWMSMSEAREAIPSGPSLQIFPSSGSCTVAPNADMMSVLSTAMEFERKGYNNYRKAANESTDPTARQIFTYLADFEEKHYEYLEKHYGYLNDTGTWAFFDMERPIFDE